MPGELAQFRFRFPPVTIPVGGGQERNPKQLAVLTMVSGYSRSSEGSLLTRGITVRDQPRPHRGHVRPQHRRGPGRDLPGRRHRIAQCCTHRAPVHPVLARELPDRHLFTLTVSSDTFELLHFRLAHSVLSEYTPQALPAATIARLAPGGCVVEYVNPTHTRITLGAWSWAGIAGLLDADLTQMEPSELREACHSIAQIFQSQ